MPRKNKLSSKIKSDGVGTDEREEKVRGGEADFQEVDLTSLEYIEYGRANYYSYPDLKDDFAQELVAGVSEHLERLGVPDDLRANVLKQAFDQLTEIIDPTVSLPSVAPEYYRDRSNRLERAAEFTLRVYGEWLGRGLTRPHIKSLDEPLYRALYKQGIPESLAEVLPTAQGRNVSQSPRKNLDEGTGEGSDHPTSAPALWTERKTGRDVSPADFIQMHYGKTNDDGTWDPDGVTRATIRNLDRALYNAYSQQISRNPEQAIPNLPSQPAKIDDPAEAIERRRAASRDWKKSHRDRTP